MNQVQNGKAAILGLQHLLAMYAGAVAVPLLIGMGLGFDEAQMTYLISIDIFMCGVATLLQLTVTKFFGIGLPVVLGCAIQAVSPLIIIGSKKWRWGHLWFNYCSGHLCRIDCWFILKSESIIPTNCYGNCHYGHWLNLDSSGDY